MNWFNIVKNAIRLMTGEKLNLKEIISHNTACTMTHLHCFENTEFCERDPSKIILSFSMGSLPTDFRQL
jgi:hypothetical protein